MLLRDGDLIHQPGQVAAQHLPQGRTSEQALMRTGTMPCQEVRESQFKTHSQSAPLRPTNTIAVVQKCPLVVCAWQRTSSQAA